MDGSRHDERVEEASKVKTREVAPRPLAPQDVKVEVIISTESGDDVAVPDERSARKNVEFSNEKDESSWSKYGLYYVLNSSISIQRGWDEGRSENIVFSQESRALYTIRYH